MPYPTDNPVNKHDILTPTLPSSSSDQSLLSSDYNFNFASTSSIFEHLESPGNIMEHKHKLTYVYTYADAPTSPRPLSRALVVLGFADSSISLVRKITDPDNTPSCLQKCTLAVKNADAHHRDHLNSKNKQLSNAFAKLMRKLRNEGAVAIIGGDKYGRFGILCPMELEGYGGGQEGEYQAEDFAACCFVGKVEEVKELLVQGIGGAAQDAAEATTSYSADADGGDDGFWKPPGGEEDDNKPSNGFGGESGDGGFWKPPADEDDNDGSGGGGGMDFGGGETSGNGFDSWQPSSPSMDTGMMSGQKRDRSDFEDGDGSADNENGGNTFHADTGAAAADKFYSGLTRTLDTRADSRLYHMRAFNGWVKATQIAELNPKTKKRAKRSKLRVLDLACGKGGDLGKWTLHNRGIENYVGVDVARGSLKDAAIRARKMRNKLQRCTFTCADLGADVPGRLRSKQSKRLQKLLSWSLANEAEYESADPVFTDVSGGGISTDDKFDVVSIQFAIHYMMSTKKRARRFFQTVSELLEVGGNLIATTIDARVVLKHMMNLGLDFHFDDDDDDQETKENGDGKSKGPYATVKTGNGACRLKFEKEIVKRLFKRQKQDSNKLEDDMFGLEYTFTLVEGEDHSAGVGEAVDLPEWLTPIPALTMLAKEAGLELEYASNFHEFYAVRKDPRDHPSSHNALYNMKVLDRNGSISKDEWEISRMYIAVKFRKVSESTMVLEEDDEAEEEEEDEAEDESKQTNGSGGFTPPVMTPATMKMIPLAMMKAKTAAGGIWGTLSSDEKNQRMQEELAKMI